MKAAFLFCDDLAKDHCGARILAAAERATPLEEVDLAVDGKPVLGFADAAGNAFRYVRTREVLSHDYPHYAPILNEHFGDFDFVACVNWHEGMNAPDRVLTIHTTGDVETGNFGPADPVHVRNVLLALERERVERGLDDFQTVTEGTHWSGMMYAGKPEWILDVRPPVYDVEIGSSPESWANPLAAEVVAAALPQVFAPAPPELRSLLCVGGVHIETNFPVAVLDTRDDTPLAISHVLPNQWVVSGGYDGEAGLEKLRACVASIAGGIHAIVFHKKLQGPYKEALRVLSEELGVPAFKHPRLREPAGLELWG